MSRTSRPFQVMVDSGSHEEPQTRYYGSLEAALEAALALDKRWHPYVTVSEFLEDGGRVVHVRAGKLA